MVKKISDGKADRRVRAAIAASDEASITSAADIPGRLIDALNSGDLSMSQLGIVGGFLRLRPSELIGGRA